MKKPRPHSNFLWRWKITSTISDQSNILCVAGVGPVWDFGGLISALCIRNGLGAANLCLRVQGGGISQAQLLLLPSVRFYFDAAEQFGVTPVNTIMHHSPPPASAQPHRHLKFIKFSMSCIFMCTGSLFWVYLVYLMPLGSSALFFPSQLIDVHTFPISLETVSTLEEVFLGDIKVSWQGTAKNRITTLFSCSRPQWSAFLQGETQFPSSEI